MPKEDIIETSGVVTELVKGGSYKVKLENGHTVIARVSGKMQTHSIRILPGDTVDLQISPYDLTRGRITYRRS